MKILVTGGTGFIGSHTVVELTNAGFEPVILDNLSNSNRAVLDGIRHILGKVPKFYEVDCRNEIALAEVFQNERPDAIIHFAAFKAVGESVEKPLEYYDNNVGAMITLLKVMRKFNVKNFVFSSSCTVYGQPDHLPVTELSPDANAASPYGYTKVMCEQIIRDSSKVCGLNTAILRYFNPIGAHASGHIGELPNGVPNNLVPFITQTAIGKREKLTVFGDDYNTSDGTCIRDFIHVVDLAKAHVAALNWLVKNDNQLEIFNLGQGKGNTVLEVVKAFVKVSGQNLNYEIGPRRAGDVEQIWADVQKSEKMLQWKTQLTIEDGLKDAWNWELKLKANFHTDDNPIHHNA